MNLTYNEVEDELDTKRCWKDFIRFHMEKLKSQK